MISQHVRYTKRTNTWPDEDSEESDEETLEVFENSADQDLDEIVNF